MEQTRYRRAVLTLCRQLFRYVRINDRLIPFEDAVNGGWRVIVRAARTALRVGGNRP